MYDVVLSMVGFSLCRWDMDIFKSYCGNLPGEWQGGGFAFTESYGVGVSCGVGKGAEYRGFKCD